MVYEKEEKRKCSEYVPPYVEAHLIRKRNKKESEKDEREKQKKKGGIDKEKHRRDGAIKKEY